MPVYLRVHHRRRGQRAVSGRHRRNSTSHFTVSTPDLATRSGNCLLPKISAGGFMQSGTNITIRLHRAARADHGRIAVTSISPRVLPADGQYQVAAIPDATHFTITSTTSSNQTQSSFTIYPLAAPPLTRSGNVVVQ